MKSLPSGSSGHSIFCMKASLHLRKKSASGRNGDGSKHRLCFLPVRGCLQLRLLRCSITCRLLGNLNTTILSAVTCSWLVQMTTSISDLESECDLPGADEYICRMDLTTYLAPLT